MRSGGWWPSSMTDEFLWYPCTCCGGSLASLPLDARCSIKRHMSYCSATCEFDWESFLDDEDRRRAARKASFDWEDALYAAE